ncbi:MAG: NAD-dependent epimerase/dehydratase family protein [Lachnospiraceae bacterium]|nr:NAD-dependent epimerase/dehydratase family protein [Lachnospiraceae bacterium]
MKILVIGGTRFFGVHMVNELLAKGHDITIATRGMAKDGYGDRVGRIIFQRTDEQSVKEALAGKHFDVIIDKIAYCSEDIRYVMEAADCDRYIHMSSTSVYDPKHWNTVESDFDGRAGKLIWCDRGAFPYEEIKRQAEYALWQAYPDRKWLAVRYPFAIGEDDYTKRLIFYVEHTMKGIPMYIDNADRQMGFIRSDEAGRFLAFLAEQDVTGAVNGSSDGTISVREILEYVEQKTGEKAILQEDGDAAPYNGEPEYSINTDRAKSMGFEFSVLSDYIYDLLDHSIDSIR